MLKQGFSIKILLSIGIINLVVIFKVVSIPNILIKAEYAMDKNY